MKKFLKKIKCILSGNHMKFAKSIKKCSGIKDGFDTITCGTCFITAKRRCDFEHCDCCGRHCPQVYGVLNTWGCVCTKCCLTRTLTLELWNDHKLVFLRAIRMYIRQYDRNIVEEVLKNGECKDVFDEIQKLLILT